MSVSVRVCECERERVCVCVRGGRYTGMNVTTGIMLCHDMDFAIPWIPLHIHGFHWMDRQRFFPRGHYCVIRERERCPA